MMCISDVIGWLKTKYPGVGVYNQLIPKRDPFCIGVYRKQRGVSALAVGGVDCTSFDMLPVDFLIHWGEAAGACETTANSLYDLMRGNLSECIGGHAVRQFALQDAAPAGIGRDEDNICEMIVRVNIIYETTGK
ncbi:hypothetical protein [Ethanoligenens sp.]|uniref:hypothetical protein n=1 Tax=Ethanoligenens sp. TaxID=2099655 RepID=UPI0039E8636E